MGGQGGLSEVMMFTQVRDDKKQAAVRRLGGRAGRAEGIARAKALRP